LIKITKNELYNDGKLTPLESSHKTLSELGNKNKYVFNTLLS